MKTPIRMKFITQTFFKGLIVLLPIAAAVYVLTWLVRKGESWLEELLLFIIPENYYIPGMGFVLMLVIIFFVGLLMYPWVTRKFLKATDSILRKIPIFGMIYSPVRDLMDVLGGDMEQELGQAVLVKVPNTNMEMLGFITRDELTNLPDGFNKKEHVAVFVPWSYQIGGFCFIVPREIVKPVAVTVEQGLRWSFTAGISAPTALKAMGTTEEEKISE